MAIGTGITGRQNRKERNAQSGGRVRPGGERVTEAATKAQESLVAEVDGEMVEVFVYGVHAPDDPNVTRYVI